MALAEGFAGPLGPERAVGGIGSIRSSRRAPRPLAASKADVSKKQPHGRFRPHNPGEALPAHRPHGRLIAHSDNSTPSRTSLLYAGVQHFSSILFIYG
jgi:hypothetical protein